VASFDLHVPIPPHNLERALNRILPPSIRICDARIVDRAFHARHSATSKTYEYRVLLEQPALGAICTPFLARYVYACAWPLNLVALQTAASSFLGEHDFLSFAATEPDLATRTSDPAAKTVETLTKKNTIRAIYSSTWERKTAEGGEMLVYRVRGSGFLHHMVRNLVGTMLDMGRGYRSANEIPAILAARSRSAAGPTAPARGLFLQSVEYGMK
jgi:tRNA pseudouridine38-40 synthase